MLGISILFVAVGLLAIAVGAVYGLRRHPRGNVPARGLTISLVALGAALIFLADLDQRIESALWPSLGRYLSNACTMVAVYGLTVLVADIAGTSRRRRARAIVMAVAVASLTAMFFASPTPSTHGIGVFGDLYERQPTLLVYVAVYIVYLAFGVLDAAVISGSAALASRGRQRTSLTLITAACLLALAYLSDKADGIVAGLLSSAPARDERCMLFGPSMHCVFSVDAPAASVLLATAGVALPLAYRALCRRLITDTYPLRRGLRNAHPGYQRIDTSIIDPLHHQALAVITEVHDGMMSYGIPPDRSNPRMAGRALHAALRDGSADGSPDASTPRTASVPADVLAELRYLRKVTKEFQRASR
jgi:hypothetical protein